MSRSLATSLALRHTLIAVVLFGGLFYFSFLLTRWFLWQGLKAAGITKYERIAAMLGADQAELDKATLIARIREISPQIPSQFYVEFVHSAHGHLYRTPNLRGASLAAPRRTDNVYLIQISPQGEFYVQTFRDRLLTIRIGQDLDSVRLILGSYVRASIVLFVAVLSLNAFLIWRASRHALRPVRAMQLAAEHISSENLGERIAIGPERDEISDLGMLLNRTFDRLQASFEQIRRFTADASHELRTPLTVARAQAEKLLRPDLDPASHEEAAQGVLVELTQLEQVIEDLLLLARSDSHALPFTITEIPLAGFWDEIIPEVEALAEYHRLQFKATCDRTGTVHGDRRWLRHVVLNLVNNSIRHSPAGGTLRLTSRVDENLWHLSVEDEGPGVPAEKLERIFERFYQVRADDEQVMEGTGLGLAICRSLVHMHRGTITAGNRESGRGLRVHVELPV